MALTVISADHWSDADEYAGLYAADQNWGVISGSDFVISTSTFTNYGTVLRLSSSGGGAGDDTIRLTKDVANEVDAATRLYFQTKINSSEADWANRDVSNNTVHQGLIRFFGPLEDTSDSIALSYDNGVISVTQGVGSATEFDSSLASTAGAVTAGSWHHLEISILPGLSGTGRISMKLDGVLEFDEVACSVDVNVVGIGHAAAIRYFSLQTYWEDTIIATSDSASVEWLGPHRVYPVVLANLTQNAGVFEDGSVANADELRLNATPVYLDTGDELLFNAISEGGYGINPTAAQVKARSASGGTIHAVQKNGASRADSPGQPSAALNTFDWRALSPDDTIWTREKLYSLEFGVEV